MLFPGESGPPLASYPCRRALCAIVAAFCTLSPFAPTAPATTVNAPTFDELVKEAQVIFEGRVTDVRSAWVGENETRRIESYITFEVLDPIKGRVSSPYVLQVTGGTVGEVTMQITDAPTFTKGERAVLFIENNGTQVIPLVGIMHGSYKLKTDPASGREVVAKPNGQPMKSVREIGPAARSAARAPVDFAPITPGAFKQEIRTRLNERAR
jgi:hypothetical protein